MEQLLTIFDRDLLLKLLPIVIGVLIYLTIDLIVSYNLSAVAKTKGHDHTFAICFFLSVPGWIYVASLPDLELRKTRAELLELMKQNQKKNDSSLEKLTERLNAMESRSTERIPTEDEKTTDPILERRYRECRNSFELAQTENDFQKVLDQCFLLADYRDVEEIGKACERRIRELKTEQENGFAAETAAVSIEPAEEEEETEETPKKKSILPVIFLILLALGGLGYAGYTVHKEEVHRFIGGFTEQSDPKQPVMDLVSVNYESVSKAGNLITCFYTLTNGSEKEILSLTIVGKVTDEAGNETGSVETTILLAEPVKPGETTDELSVSCEITGDAHMFTVTPIDCEVQE